MAIGEILGWRLILTSLLDGDAAEEIASDYFARLLREVHEISRYLTMFESLPHGLDRKLGVDAYELRGDEIVIRHSSGRKPIPKPVLPAMAAWMALRAA